MHEHDIKRSKNVENTLFSHNSYLQIRLFSYFPLPGLRKRGSELTLVRIVLGQTEYVPAALFSQARRDGQKRASYRIQGHMKVSSRKTESLEPVNDVVGE
jgi:hypothetical protein